MSDGTKDVGLPDGGSVVLSRDQRGWYTAMEHAWRLDGPFMEKVEVDIDGRSAFLTSLNMDTPDEASGSSSRMRLYVEWTWTEGP